MTDVKRGEIWQVNLDPTIGHEIKKTRPALIIQNDIGNKYSPITIIAPLTSQKTQKVYPVEVLIRIRDVDAKVLLNHIRAIDKERLVKKIGSISKEQLFQVGEAIKISLGLVQLPLP